MRVLLIHNPGAGQQAKEDLEQLLAIIRECGHEVRYKSAKDDDWAKALEEPADVVAVAGGDGTVARVVKKMVDRGIPVAPLPAGTANNISTTLGIVGRPLEELVQGWKDARRVKLDVGVAEGPWGRRYFVEGVGAGLFAQTVPLVDSDPRLNRLKTPADKVRFALQKIDERLENLSPVFLKASLDGKDLSGDYLMFEALNIPYIGPNLFLAPDSQQGDGEFDVVMVTEAERARLSHYLRRWQEKKPRLAVLPSHRGKHLHIDWTGFRVHIDDEFWPEEDEEPQSASGAIDLRMRRAAVEVLAPADPKAQNSKHR